MASHQENRPGSLPAQKLGPFWLMPGISRFNGLSYFTTAMVAIPMMAALSFLQPMILRIVGIDRAIHLLARGAQAMPVIGGGFIGVE